MKDDNITKMKLCFLCNSQEYSEIDGSLHEKFGWHKTGNITWTPVKGHEKYELHKKWMKLLI